MATAYVWTTVLLHCILSFGRIAGNLPRDRFDRAVTALYVALTAWGVCVLWGAT